MRRDSEGLSATQEQTASVTPVGGSLAEHYRRVRRCSVALSEPLSAEDMLVQSMPEASPGKWHLAHTTWFFERFVLMRDAAYRPRDPAWHYLFNSYYQTVGPMHERPRRGLLSRPSLAEVLDYRRRVDEAMEDRLALHGDTALPAIVELGLHHEQQHQELLLTDIKHALWSQPLRPAYVARAVEPWRSESPSLRFITGREGIVHIGHAGDGFAFDNEMPRHKQWLAPHALANRPVTNAEYRAFIDDGGYRDATLWLDDGWHRVQSENWRHPLYWQDDLASEFTLAGERTIDPQAPVCHLSYFEADAFARWAGARLPTEAEWEAAAAPLPVAGNLLESGALHPRAADASAATGLQQFHGDVWEWTASPYTAYPGYRPLPGALGEYNGKFMNGQWVLRGGSCATPRTHIRTTYRNFFPPHARWQFSGLRLAQDR